MNRRTFDVAVPILYVAALLIAVFIGQEAWVGGVAAIGAMFVALYYAALRQNLKS